MKKIIFLLIAALFINFSIVGDSYAFAQVDGGKAGSKIGEFFGKMKEKGEAAFKWVSESKFGKFVGKGIKAAKDGIAFAKDAYKAANEFKDSILESPEYKAAMISKQIADVTKEVVALQKSKQENEKNVKLEISALQETGSAKIGALQENIANLKKLASQAEKDKEAAAESASSSKSDPEALTRTVNMSYDFAGGEADNAIAIERINSETDAKVKGLEENLSTQNSDVNKQIIAKTKEIAQLTKKLADVVNITVKVKKSKQDPEKDLAESKKKLFLQPNQPQTIQNINEKRHERKIESREIITQKAGEVTKTRYEAIDKREEIASTAETGESAPGSSEATAVNTNLTVEYGDQLYQFVSLVLADLQREVSVEIANYDEMSSRNPDKDITAFNLDNYESVDAKTALKGLINKAKNKIQQVKDTAAEIKGAASAVSQASQDLKGMGSDLKGLAGSQTDLLNIEGIM